MRSGSTRAATIAAKAHLTRALHAADADPVILAIRGVCALLRDEALCGLGRADESAEARDAAARDLAAANRLGVGEIRTAACGAQAATLVTPVDDVGTLHGSPWGRQARAGSEGRSREEGMRRAEASRSLIPCVLVVLATRPWPETHVAVDKKTSKELAAMYRQDQEDQDRWDELGDAEASRRQTVRRDRALEVVAQGLLDEPIDYYHASMLFQHGEQVDDYLLAHVLASAAALDGETQAFFLSAAALDRYLMSREQLQRFGSQSSDAAGEDLGDTSKMLSEAFVQVFRRSAPYERSGLDGRPLDKEARAKKNLRAAQKELAKLAKEASKEAGTEPGEPADEMRSRIARVLEIAERGQLEQAEDFHNAALVLAQGSGVDELLLAHISATAAGLLGHEPARKLFKQTLDGFQRSLGQTPVFADVDPSAGDPARSKVLELHERVRLPFGGKGGRKP